MKSFILALLLSGASLNSIPVNIIPPVITGTPVVGNTLSRTQGIWSGNPTPSLTGTWCTNLSPIPICSFTVSSNPTYVIEAAFVDYYIFYRETGTNSVGSAIANSNILGPITF